MKNRRSISAIIALLSLALLGVSAWSMSNRIVAFHKTNPRKLFAFQEVQARQFTYAGHPVAITEEKNGDETTVVITYGDQTLRLRPTIPGGNAKLPDLLPYLDWMRVMRFVPAGGEPMNDTIEKMNRGEIPDRLVIGTRTPRAGTNPETWGAVWRKDWDFNFYEFKVAGGWEHQKLGYPTNRRSEAPKPGELRENTWEMQAALQLMPKGRTPNYSPRADALSAVGWTLPLCTISLMGLVAAVIVGTPGRHMAATPA